MNNHLGGMAHCTLKEGAVSKAVCHKTVSEFWYILSGIGAIWRKDAEQETITTLEAGISIDIPLWTDFQYRSDKGDLVFICVTIPPWSGHNEASLDTYFGLKVKTMAYQLVFESNTTLCDIYFQEQNKCR